MNNQERARKGMQNLRASPSYDTGKARDKDRKSRSRSRSLDSETTRETYRKQKQNQRTDESYRKSNREYQQRARQSSLYRTQERRRDRENRRIARNNLKTITKVYRETINEGPVKICVCCGGLFFSRSVKKLLETRFDSTPAYKLKVFDVNLISDDNNYYACITCGRAMDKRNIPTLALSNSLKFNNIDDSLSCLNDTEVRLVSPRVAFIRIKPLGWDGQKGLVGNVVNVPINVEETLQKVLPRTPDQSYTMQLRYMRKMDYKNPYKYDQISPYKMKNALRFLVKQDLFITNNIEISQDWLRQNITAVNNPSASQNFIIDKEDEGIFEAQSSILKDQERSKKNFYKNKGPNNDDFDDDGDENLPQPSFPTSTISQAYITSLSNGGIHVNIDLDTLHNGIQQRYQYDDDDDSESDVEGKTDNFVRQNRYHKTQPTLLENVVSIAPGEDNQPEYFLDDPFNEELQFIKEYGGKTCKYPTKLSYQARVKSEFRRYDRRMALNIEKIFYSFRKLQGLKLRDATSTALRKTKTQVGGREVNFTAGMVRDPEQMKKLIDKEEALLFLRAIRSSPQFWEWKKTEINAMIRQIGTPTFFVTFSPSEANWFELIVVLMKVLKKKDITIAEAKNLPKKERLDLINQDPITVARYFENRMRGLLKFIFARGGVFRDNLVNDYFYRIDFQYR